MAKKAPKTKKAAKPRRTKTIKVKVDAEAFDSVQELFAAHGTTFEIWCSMQIRSIGRSQGKLLLGLKDKMSNGKYLGEVIENVVRADTSYAVWMLQQDFKVKYLPEVHELANELSGGALQTPSPFVPPESVHVE